MYDIAWGKVPRQTYKYKLAQMPVVIKTQTQCAVSEGTRIANSLTSMSSEKEYTTTLESLIIVPDDHVPSSCSRI